VIVISDTSPLCYLVVIGHVDVLPALYGRILCPPEVLAECLHPQAPTALRAWIASPPVWLVVVRPVSSWTHSELNRLDEGESAAIRLAHEQAADLLLMDERKGRQIAQRLGFRVSGILAVIADAARRQLLDFDQAVFKLTQETNFRVSPMVIEAIRSQL
jgi:predicted nucleic acid-binding protein